MRPRIHTGSWLLAAGVLLLLPAAAAAQDYYARDRGDLIIALALAGPGDTVILKDGIYEGPFTLVAGGTSSAPLTIKAEHDGKAVIEGSGTARDALFVAGEYKKVPATLHDVRIEGLTVRGATRAGLRISWADRVTVLRSTFTDNGTWGVFSDYADDTTLRGNVMRGSKAEHGIYLSNGGDRPVIEYNRVEDNAASGIQINADPDSVIAGLGKTADGITEGARVAYNIVQRNGAKGGASINLASVRGAAITGNLLADNLAGGIAAWGNGAGTDWGSKDLAVTRNTVWFEAGEGRWALSLKEASTGAHVTENVLAGGARGAIEFDADSLAGFASARNLLGRTGASRDDLVTDETTGDVWTLAAWQAAGYDAGSRFADSSAVLSDPSIEDFRFVAGSAALTMSATAGPIGAPIAIVGPNGVGSDDGIVAPDGSAELVKGSGAAVYFHYGAARYAFPTDRMFKTWYPDFSSVRRVSDASLASLALRGLVLHRPGTRMVKIQTDPRVYAVTRRGVLRHIKGEAVATALYGPAWGTLVDDVDDGFFAGFTVGDPIETAADYFPPGDSAAIVSPEQNL